MLALLLCTAVQTSGPVMVREFQLELEHMDDFVMAADGSFMVHVYMDEAVRQLSGVYRYNASTKKLERFCDGYAAREQKDFGAGIFSVVDDAHVDHYDVVSGKLIGSVAKERYYARTGEWVAERPDYERWKFRNLRSSKVVKSEGFSSAIWATKDRLYLVLRNIERQSPPVDTYFELREIDANTLQTLRSVRFGRNELSDIRIVGDPAKPPFVLERSFVGVGVEAFDYELVSKDWKLVGKSYPAIFEVRGDRFLVGTSLRDENDTYTKSGGVECRSISGDSVVWDKWFGETVEGVSWRGDEVWVGLRERTVVLNAGNGAVRRTVEGAGLVLPRSQREPREWDLKADSKRNTLTLVRNRA